MRRLNRKSEPRQHILNLDHQKSSNPEIRKNLCKDVMRNINCNSEFSYSEVSNAVVKATSAVLPKRDKAQLGYFRAEETHLLPLIEARIDAMEMFLTEGHSTTKHKQTRKNFRSAVHETKSKWIKSQCALLNTNIGTKSA